MRLLSILFRVLRGLTFLLLLAGIVAYTPVARRYADSHVYAVDNKQPITITSSPGEQLSLGIKMPSAVSGLWAAPDGLTLQLGEKSRLMDPIPQTWGDEITTDSRDGSEDQTATGRFVVPDAAAQTVLEGKITGTVVYPVGGLGTFRNEQIAVDIPVKITVAAGGEQGWSPGAQLDALVYGIIACTTLMILFALARIVQSVVRHGAKGIGGALFTATFVTGFFVFIAFVAEKEATPDVSDVDVLGGLPVTPTQLIIGLGVAVFLTLFGMVMGPPAEAKPEPAPTPA